MEEKLIRTKLIKSDIIPAGENDVCCIGGNSFPVNAYISTGIGDIPIADIPVMTDEKWQELSKKHKGQNVSPPVFCAASEPLRKG